MLDPNAYTQTEIALANRNRGMPLEALRYDITPVGMHYSLTHFDTWRSWSFDWTDAPGEHRLSCRASGANGRTQPLERDWNLGGYCNNMVQTITLTVE